MRNLLRLALYVLGLLSLAAALLVVTQLRPARPGVPASAPHLTGEAAGQSTRGTTTQPAPAATQAGETPSGSASSPAPAVPLASVPPDETAETIPPDLVQDPGDPLYNDAPTGTLSLSSPITQVANLRHAHLTFEFEFANEGPGTVTGLEVYVVIPPPEAHQRLTGLQFSGEYDVVRDRYGEELARFMFEDLVPGTQARVSWSGDVEVRSLNYGLSPEEAGGFDDIPADILADYLSDEEKYRLDSPTIQRAARVAAGGASDPYWIARNVHDFVAKRLSYSNDGKWDDAETVYLQRNGSCSEYAFLYIALCRANGLPARYAAGTRQRKAGVYIDTLFHRWAEIYLPPYGWVPVDVLHDDVLGGPRYDYFGGISDERFVTTVNGGGSEYLGWNYHYGYRYDYEGSKPKVTRSRRFIWEPYPSELRVTLGKISGSAQAGTGEVSLGRLGILTTNGSYGWSMAAAPSWLRLEASAGDTPQVVEVLLDTAALSPGLLRGELTLESPEIDSAVSIPVEVAVSQASAGSR